ncbi:hypothetical protein [Gluconobacter sp. DsW_058]|uniref:hypothetical protein n=1 Tax=Gluconobacter sp. DsW_058 TaxID=1511210 RepID=UPI000B720C50|nr:hypothetical protein [Gluconobacter sp. DsW_058]OUJ04954.1 hypothetical protein HK24_13260 [Gluconobacter sp. DsW_058]
MKKGANPTIFNIPPAKEFWPLPTGMHGSDADSKLLFESVGEALSVYEVLEEEMSYLFSVFVESSSSAAERAYGVCTSSRKDVLQAAAGTFFTRKNAFLSDIDDFKEIGNHHVQCSAIRNNIAHGVGRRFFNKQEKEVFSLVSPSYNSRKMKYPGDDRVFTYDIEKYGSKYYYGSEFIKSFADKTYAFRGMVHMYAIMITQSYDHDVYKSEKFPEVFHRPSTQRLQG